MENSGITDKLTQLKRELNILANASFDCGEIKDALTPEYAAAKKKSQDAHDRIISFLTANP